MSRRWRHFVLPNLQILNSGNIVGFDKAHFIQCVRLSGAGRIEADEACKFGYEAGGFFYGPGIELQARTKESLIKIGTRVSFNNNVFICAANRIEIGKDVLIGQGVTMMDFEAHGIHPKRRKEMGPKGTIFIDDNVWIGNNVTILRDSRIGKNSIIAAGAVVKGQFPDNVIIGGCPARIIKEIEVV